MATNGIVLIKPTSIEISGSGSETASINQNGSVSFLDCNYIALDGVFSSTYDNYIIDVGYSPSAINLREIFFDFRVGGSEVSAPSSFTQQEMTANGTAVTAGRFTSSQARIGWTSGGSAVGTEGLQIFCYGPALAQPKAIRSLGINNRSQVSMTDTALTHNQSSSYDGFFLSPLLQVLNGIIKVYGLVK